MMQYHLTADVQSWCCLADYVLNTKRILKNNKQYQFSSQLPIVGLDDDLPGLGGPDISSNWWLEFLLSFPFPCLLVVQNRLPYNTRSVTLDKLY